MSKAVALKDNPAKWSDKVLAVIEPVVEAERLRLGHEPRILDPFAGTGKIHILGTKTVGVEIEPEWALHHPRTRVGDSRFLRKMFRRSKPFNLVITSCTYGNRMADHHDAQERCKPCGATGTLRGKKCQKCDGKGRREYRRNTYRHYLERELSEGSSAGMQWGDEYREFHRAIWEQIPDILEPGGAFILNVSDHYRTLKKGDEPTLIRVSDWHRRTILSLDAHWRLEATYRVKTQRLRQGANHGLRAQYERVYVFRYAA